MGTGITFFFLIIECLFCIFIDQIPYTQKREFKKDKLFLFLVKTLLVLGYIFPVLWIRNDLFRIRIRIQL